MKPALCLWDQCVSNLSQTVDYPVRDRRHGFRLTPLANRLIPTKVEEDEGKCLRDEGRVQLNFS